jgi:HEAT repeat protein
MHIVKSLKDKNPEVRKAACVSLSRKQDGLYIQELIQMTKDVDEDVRTCAKDCIASLLGVEF